MATPEPLVIVFSPAEWEEARRKWGEDPDAWFQKMMAEWYEQAKTLSLSDDAVSAGL